MKLSVSGVAKRLAESLPGARPPVSSERDMRPAVGQPGGPASWKREVDGAPVALHRREWADARWSSIYRLRSGYADAERPEPERIEQANLRGRRGTPPSTVQGPILRAPVWTWQIPVYFWFGGMAAGATFIAAGCEVAGDPRGARVARAVALGALGPCPVLLIMDLGRPARFFNMLRIFKPRSPMSTGTYCVSMFGGLSALSVGADLLGRRRAARRLGAANVPVAVYLGSYTGVLLAATAVPVWSRSRAFLGPIFAATAVLAGASSTRLALTATGRGRGDATREALARIEDGALSTELLLSMVNRHRLGPLAAALEEGVGGTWFKRAQWLGRTGLLARTLSPRVRRLDHAASVAYLGASLCFRFAWVRSGEFSAHDDVAVADNARGQASGGTLLDTRQYDRASARVGKAP